MNLSQSSKVTLAFRHWIYCQVSRCLDPGTISNKEKNILKIYISSPSVTKSSPFALHNVRSHINIFCLVITKKLNNVQYYSVPILLQDLRGKRFLFYFILLIKRQDFAWWLYFFNLVHADPGSGAFLTPGSWIGFISDPGSPIPDPQPIFLISQWKIFGLKVLQFSSIDSNFFCTV